MSEENKQEKLLIKDLKASDPTIVLAAIKKSRQEGNNKVLKVLLEVLNETDEPDVEAAIIHFLFDLKDNESIPPLVAALEDEEMTYYHGFILSAFWQSSLDGSEHLILFVQQAIKGDYMVCLEALTVIENLEGPFSEAELADGAAAIGEALEEEKNEEKKALLMSMQQVLNHLPISQPK